MTDLSEDPALDEMLWRTLKLDSRPADSAFVTKVERAVIEQERYRRVTTALSRQLVSDLLGLLAVIASLLVLSFSPDLREALAGMQLWAWGGLMSLLLLWLGTRMRVAG